MAVNEREPMQFASMAADLGVVLQQVSSVGLLWMGWLWLQNVPSEDPQ